MGAIIPPVFAPASDLLRFAGATSAKNRRQRNDIALPGDKSKFRHAGQFQACLIQHFREASDGLFTLLVRGMVYIARGEPAGGIRVAFGFDETPEFAFQGQ